MAQDRIRAHFEEAQEVLAKFMADGQQFTNIEKAASLMVAAFKNGKKVISCGNGGSMSDAMHFAEELTGRYRESRAPLPAIAISDPGYLTCTANDFGFEFVFSRFLEAHGSEGDVLVAISTSGQSRNVIEAARVAKQKGIAIVGFTGKNGGELATYCDTEIRVPHSGYADRTQEVHIKIIHSIIDAIEQQLFTG
ncbi:MAG: D-sedoheptulose 7-phosphate isomerase [Schleiferiaceae bacterium]|nr:D-sedoheptulose 7-phosphate isomerase [Schleiferiaceae bacterium]